MSLRIFIEEEAKADLREAGRHYRDVGGSALALRFIARVHDRIDLVSKQPDMGRDFAELALREELRGLQWIRVLGFPHLLFWTHDTHTLRVWAVPHAHGDLPDQLRARFTR